MDPTKSVPVTTPEASSDGGVNAILIAVVVLIAVLVAGGLAIMVYILYCRHRRNEWSPKDQEEGKELINTSADSPDKSETHPSNLSAGKTPSRLSGEIADSTPESDEQNEATPILLSVQPNTANEDPELTDFENRMKHLPMIDEAVDLEDNVEPHDSVDSSHRSHDSLSKSHDSLPRSHDSLSRSCNSLPESHDTTPEEAPENEVMVNGDIKADTPPSEEPVHFTKQKLPDAEKTSQSNIEALKVKRRKHRGVSPERDALTESMVLTMLDKQDDSGVAPGANTSFSSLPEDSQPIIDLQVQADVHHRTVSFDGVEEDGGTQPETVPSTTQPDGGLSSNKTQQGDSDKNLPVIHEQKPSGLVNGFHSNDSHMNHNEVNGNHVDSETNSQTGPSVVVDNSLNEITSDPR